MEMRLRCFTAWLIAMAGAAAGAGQSQSYPNKTVRLIVVGPAAGGADVLARPIASKVSESFGQQVIVDNRGGGGGIPGTQAALTAAPDGYTMMFANAINMAIAPALRRKLSYDPLRDFSPVTLVATTPLMVAVHPSLPVNSMKDVISLAKAKPGHILCASNGEGTIQHLTIEMLNRTAGIALLHVPYKGGTPAVIDTVGGHAHMIITAAPTVLSQVRASRLRAVAVTSPKRTDALPEVPTVAESGWPGFEAIQWYGLFGPGKTPNGVIDKWAAEVQKAVESATVKAVFSQEGAEVAVIGPQALAAFHRTDVARWQKVVRESKIALD